jgi:tetratricopeptide (TPR) repeat protein
MSRGDDWKQRKVVGGQWSVLVSSPTTDHRSPTTIFGGVETMKKRFIHSLIILLIGLVVCGTAAAQRPGQSSRDTGAEISNISHTLFGDFKVDESRVSGSKPSSYQVVLYTAMGRAIGRQSVSGNGRYYFHNVPTGEYYVVAELEGTEVARIRVMAQAMFKSEIRNDIELEWRDRAITAKSNTPATVSATNVYSRSPENQNTFDKAQEAISKKEYKQAATMLNQILSADTKDYQAWTSLGTVYFIQEKPGEAEKAFKNALGAKPDLQLAQLSLGKAQMAQKSFEPAIETLTKAVEADPRSAEANFLLGESYLQIKKGSKAVGYLNEAIRLDPMGMADAHLRLGTLYRGAGLKDKAVAEFEQFLAKRPNYPDKEKLQQYISENKPK